jgi:hypothetical protein
MIGWIRERFHSIKMAWQRAFRGYDDLLLWNINSYILEHSLAGLRYMRKHGKGYPAVVHVDGEEEESRAYWKMTLDKMILGLESMQNLIDNEYILSVDERAELRLEFEEAWKLMDEYFEMLWD